MADFQPEHRIRSTGPTLAYVVAFVVICGTVAGLTIFGHPAVESPGTGASHGTGTTGRPLLERAFAEGVDHPLAHRLDYAVVDTGKDSAILVRDDPDAAGKRLFGKHCATCHNFGNDFKSAEATAADLAGFGTKKWIAGLLANPGSPAYFGHTKLGTMAKWVEKTRQRAVKDKQEKQLEADFDTLAGWLASHPRADAPLPDAKESPFTKGYEVFYDRCAECHTYKAQSARDALTAPDLAGYGDAEWIRLMMLSPNHVLRYSLKNTMPLFRDLSAPDAENTRQEQARLKDYLLIQLTSDDPRLDEKKQQIEASTRLVNLPAIDRELIIRYVLKP